MPDGAAPALGRRDDDLRRHVGDPAQHHREDPGTLKATVADLEGAKFEVDGESVAARAGQIVGVPANAAHAFVNSGDGPLRTVSIHPRDQMTQEWL
ncbi:MAG: cupin domain-containing protein [Thermoleophilaceae bacterium]